MHWADFPRLQFDPAARIGQCANGLKSEVNLGGDRRNRCGTREHTRVGYIFLSSTPFKEYEPKPEQLKIAFASGYKANKFLI